MLLMSFLSPEAALLLVSTKSLNFWPGPTLALEVLNSDFPSLCVCSELTLTYLIGCEYETNSLHMLRKADLARGHNSWCWQKGAWPGDEIEHMWNFFGIGQGQSLWRPVLVTIFLVATSGHFSSERFKNVYFEVFIMCKSIFLSQQFTRSRVIWSFP